jgi:glucose-6-phosphate isomerase
MNTTPPTQCPAWAKLASHALARGSVRLAELFAADPARGARLVARAPGLRFDYSRQRLDSTALGLLEQLAEERGLAEWRAALLSGAPVNTTENRAAWHTALRAGGAAPPEVTAALARMRELAARLREGRWQGATGRPIERVVHLGTGGSDLGPRLVLDALSETSTADIEFRFAANVDPVDLDRAIADADPERTLFVVVSKTFSTQETLENARAAKRWLEQRLPGRTDFGRHFVAVTASERAAREFGAAETLPMWDWVGGRYSVWSPVGFTSMCALGAKRFDEFLEGAADIDHHFAERAFGENVPVLMALIGVWNVNFLDSATQAVLPYSTALRLLPAYLQQLEMESNGKHVDREGRPVGYATAPVVWGAEGTVGQHSFHQLLHQGTQTVPADFVALEQAPGDPARRSILAAHAAAQAEALAMGLDDPGLPAYRRYPGNRPSSTLAIERLDARNLGRLLALYEHKVFVQGVIWNVNSFDQWGVELGKRLAGEILARHRQS